MGSQPFRLVESLVANVQAPPGSHIAGVSEQALVARIRAGDKGAFQELFDAYYGSLRAFALTHVGSVSVAEDLVQDVLFRVWKNRADWTLKTSLRSYLYVAARNAAAIHRRHARMVERWETDAVRNEETPGMSVGVEAADAQAEHTDLSVALDRAIARLPERCRQTVLLRREHELTYAEIAEVMGVSVKCVEGQVSKALKILRRELAAFV